MGLFENKSKSSGYQWMPEQEDPEEARRRRIAALEAQIAAKEAEKAKYVAVEKQLSQSYDNYSKGIELLSKGFNGSEANNVLKGVINRANDISSLHRETVSAINKIDKEIQDLCNSLATEGVSRSPSNSDITILKQIEFNASNNSKINYNKSDYDAALAYFDKAVNNFTSATNLLNGISDCASRMNFSKGNSYQELNSIPEKLRYIQGLIENDENILKNDTNTFNGKYVTDLSVYHNKGLFHVTTGNKTYSMTEEEKQLFASIVAAEMSGNLKYATYDDALAICSVVLNRCEMENWIKMAGSDPIGQITGVNERGIYQFEAYYRDMHASYLESAKSGNWNDSESNKSNSHIKYDIAYKALTDALNGVRNTLDFTEYHAPALENWDSDYHPNAGANNYRTNRYDKRVVFGNPVDADLSKNVTLGEATSNLKNLRGYNSNSTNTNGKTQNLTYYMQTGYTDANGNHREWETNWRSSDGQNIAVAGCGVTSLASALSTIFNDKSITPSTIADEMLENHWKNRGGDFVANVSNLHGLQATSGFMDWNRHYKEQNDTFLRNGGKIIIANNGGTHYIAINGINDSTDPPTYYVCDPMDPNSATKVWTMDNIDNNHTMVMHIAPVGKSVGDCTINNPGNRITQTQSTNSNETSTNSNLSEEIDKLFETKQSSGLKANTSTEDKSNTSSNGSSYGTNASKVNSNTGNYNSSSYSGSSSGYSAPSWSAPSNTSSYNSNQSSVNQTKVTEQNSTAEKTEDAEPTIIVEPTKETTSPTETTPIKEVEQEVKVEPIKESEKVVIEDTSKETTSPIETTPAKEIEQEVKVEPIRVVERNTTYKPTNNLKESSQEITNNDVEPIKTIEKESIVDNEINYEPLQENNQTPYVEPIIETPIQNVNSTSTSNAGKILGGIAAAAGVTAAGIYAANKINENKKDKEEEYVDDSEYMDFSYNDFNTVDHYGNDNQYERKDTILADENYLDNNNKN